MKWCARLASKLILADGGTGHHGDVANSVTDSLLRRGEGDDLQPLRQP
jgi:hypothetical protein